jgi:hypothetical protein
MKKYLIAASALTLGMAMASAAMADDTTANGPGADNAVSLLSNNDVLSNNTDNSDNSTDDNSQVNGNNLLSNNQDNDSGNFSNNQDNDQDNDQVNGNSLLSGNSDDDQVNGNSLLSGNSDDDNVNLLSGNSDDDSVAVASFNGNGDEDNDVNVETTTEIDVSVEVDIDASTTYEDSVVSSQTLNASVTGATFEDGLALLDAQGDLNTGDIHQENDAFRGFTGIATIAMDTSIGSANQAATNVTAGSDISFGD